MTPLMTAMIASRPEIVSLLLEHGADPYDSDMSVETMHSCLHRYFGRTDNVKFWLDRFPDWDLERKNKVVGGVALGHAVYMGPHRLELVKLLLEHGASFRLITRIQWKFNLNLTSCASEDGDPESCSTFAQK